MKIIPKITDWPWKRLRKTSKVNVWIPNKFQFRKSNGGLQGQTGFEKSIAINRMRDGSRLVLKPKWLFKFRTAVCLVFSIVCIFGCSVFGVSLYYAKERVIKLKDWTNNRKQKIVWMFWCKTVANCVGFFPDRWGYTAKICQTSTWSPFLVGVFFWG